MENAVQNFTLERLGNEAAPYDLKLLLRAFSERSDFSEGDANPLTLAHADLMWVRKTYSLLDHDYLNDDDRADPAIMANVTAMQDTNKKLRFVLQNDEDHLLGYWQPDDALTLDQCVLFWLDTEGQYEIAEGSTLSETLAYRTLVNANEEAASTVIKAFGDLGVAISRISEDEVFTRMDQREKSIAETPQDYRHKRYEHYRKVAGLD